MEEVLRKEFVLKVVDGLENLFTQAETDGEKHLMYELLKSVQDSLEFGE